MLPACAGHTVVSQVCRQLEQLLDQADDPDCGSHQQPVPQALPATALLSSYHQGPQQCGLDAKAVKCRQGVAIVTQKLGAISPSLRPYPIVCEAYILLTSIGLAACHKHVYRRRYAFLSNSKRRMCCLALTMAKVACDAAQCETLGKRDEAFSATQRADLADTRA